MRRTLHSLRPSIRLKRGRRALIGVRYSLHLAALGCVLLSVPLATIAAEGPQSVAASASASEVRESGGFDADRHVIAGGGGASSGGIFAIRGTIGQADADPLQPATGGVFTVTGGFWPGITPSASLDDLIFANGFEIPSP